MPQTSATNGYLSINLPVDDLPQTMTYVTVGSNVFVDTISVTYKGLLQSSQYSPVDNVVYVQTFTNNGSQITGESQWIPQP